MMRVRPGVMQKWRARYDEAVAEARSAGLELVVDDEPQGGGLSPLPPQIHAMEQVAPKETAASTFDLGCRPLVGALPSANM